MALAAGAAAFQTDFLRRPEMVLGEWIKCGAIVIDVGINRVPGEGIDAQGKPKRASSAMSPLNLRCRAQGPSPRFPVALGP